MINSDPANKRRYFIEYLLKRNPSQKFAKKYSVYLGGHIVRVITKQVSNVDDILKVTSLQQLFDIYRLVKINPTNVRLHNVYSGAISAYIKFLTGRDLRVRVITKQELSISSKGSNNQ